MSTTHVEVWTADIKRPSLTVSPNRAVLKMKPGTVHSEFVIAKAREVADRVRALDSEYAFTGRFLWVGTSLQISMRTRSKVHRRGRLYVFQREPVLA